MQIELSNAREAFISTTGECFLLKERAIFNTRDKLAPLGPKVVVDQEIAVLIKTKFFNNKVLCV